MPKAVTLLPCPSCGGRFPQSDRVCPYCGLEVALQGKKSFIPKIRYCDHCHEVTDFLGPCKHCGNDPSTKPKVPMPKPKTRSVRIAPVKPWDHIPNPLSRYFKKETLLHYGFTHDLRWSYLIIGVGCFFLFRLFFTLLFWGWGTLFHPYNIFSDLLHGVLVGGLVGLRGSGVANGAKIGALVGFVTALLTTIPIVLFAILGMWALVPEAVIPAGKSILSAWMGVSGGAAIKGAIVGAFIGFYIEYARQ